MTASGGNHGAAWSTRFISPDNSTSVPGISGIPFNGVFFSTFFGGHETSWGPSREVHSSFSSFSVSTTKS